MKLDFEITVDQQTKAHNQTFEGVSDFGCPQNSHTLTWSIFGSILPNNIKILKTIYKVLSKLDENWLSCEQNIICPYLGIRIKYDRFLPINWANIIFLNEFNFILKVSLNFTFSMNKNSISTLRDKFIFDIIPVT